MNWKLWTRILIPTACLALAAGLTAWTGQLSDQAASPFPLQPTLPYDPALAGRGDPGLNLDDVVAPVPLTIGRRQTLAMALNNLGVAPREAYEVANAMAEHVDLRKIRAGEEGAAYFQQVPGTSSQQVPGTSKQLFRLDLELRGKGRAQAIRAADGWTATWHAAVRHVEVQCFQGQLEGFLEGDIREAGGDPRVAYKMANVFQWDLDFNRDLRLGDRFDVLYEAVTLDGETAPPGDILAMTYENQGQRHEAYLYNGSHYDADGQPLKKMFLKSPLEFSRITSRFSHRRFHPVLKVHRPHYGVDYGAPTGTPVRATADGTVVSAAYTKGGGHTVKVRHPNGYLTAYLHLSRYAKGIGKGRRVRQEEVIGYVGSTGLSTGPHLDYRIQKNGRWINPLGLANEPADPIPEAELPQFLAHRDELRRRLEGGLV